MKRFYIVAFATLLSACPLVSRAQVKWFTPEVGKVIGIEAATGTSPTYPMQVHNMGRSRVVALTLAVFDTVATFAQGRIVDSYTSKPIVAARVRVTYRNLGAGCCEYKTALTDERGFFELGWVGGSGPAGSHSARRLQVEKASYLGIDTQQVSFGGSAYLHIEMATQK